MDPGLLYPEMTPNNHERNPVITDSAKSNSGDIGKQGCGICFGVEVGCTDNVQWGKCHGQRSYPCTTDGQTHRPRLHHQALSPSLHHLPQLLHDPPCPQPPVSTISVRVDNSSYSELLAFNYALEQFVINRNASPVPNYPPATLADDFLRRLNHQCIEAPP